MEFIVNSKKECKLCSFFTKGALEETPFCKRYLMRIIFNDIIFDDRPEYSCLGKLLKFSKETEN